MITPREPSRREFLAAAGVSVVALALPGESPLSAEPLYVGTYTDDGHSEGIYLLHMDPSSGRLRPVAAFNAGANPSFLAIHPHGRALYAVNEVAKGAVSAFAIARDSGTLTRLDEEPSEGSAPCFVSVDRGGRVALVANYDSGSVALLAIGTDGALARATTVDQHSGTGPNADRQSGPHAHCIVADPTNRFALSADLGADRVFVYRLDPEGRVLHRIAGGEAVMKSGAGPRHLAFHPTRPFVFVANELDSTVATLRFDAQCGILSLLDARSTLPAGWSGMNYPADIHVDPSGRTVYVSNRGHNSVAVFSVMESTGALSLVQTISTGGDWPRNFTIDPSGRWLLVANQKTDSIVVFKRVEDGTLIETGQQIAVPSPVCLRFHASP